MFSAWAYCVKGDQPHEEWEIDGVKGPNWHTNWEGHDTTDFKKQIPRLLQERINIPEKSIEELETELQALAPADREPCANSAEREALALRILAREELL
jgi:hypothetical protein